MQDSIERAADAVTFSLNNSFEHTMAKFNG
jgi:hypothetical protein